MGCTQPITISQGTVDTPLHSAMYVPATGTIIGASENYLAEFNATTGALIRTSKALSPLMGPMFMGWAGASPAVSVWNDPYEGGLDAVDHIYKDIFYFNPATLEVGLGLGVPTKNPTSGSSMHWSNGPRQFITVGTKVFMLYPKNQYVSLDSLDLVSGIYNRSSASYGFWAEQISTDGTYIFSPFAGVGGFHYYDVALNEEDWTTGLSWEPVAAEWVPSVSKCFGTCGNNKIIRVDDFATSDHFVYSLDASIRAVRLRYNSGDGLLYIPCQSSDVVAVLNPVSGAVTYKADFESPIDVVFTGSKVFAVQSSPTGLKEVV